MSYSYDNYMYWQERVQSVHLLSMILDMQEQELCLFSKYVNMIKMFEFVTVCFSWVNVKISTLFFMSDFPLFLGQKIV